MLKDGGNIKVTRKNRNCATVIPSLPLTVMTFFYICIWLQTLLLKCCKKTLYRTVLPTLFLIHTHCWQFHSKRFRDTLDEDIAKVPKANTFSGGSGQIPEAHELPSPQPGSHRHHHVHHSPTPGPYTGFTLIINSLSIFKLVQYYISTVSYHEK